MNSYKSTSSKVNYTEYFTYLDTLTESERQASIKFRLKVKFNVNRRKAEKIVAAYYAREKK